MPSEQSRRDDRMFWDLLFVMCVFITALILHCLFLIRRLEMQTPAHPEKEGFGTQGFTCQFFNESMGVKELREEPCDKPKDSKATPYCFSTLQRNLKTQNNKVRPVG